MASDDVTYYWRLYNRECAKVEKLKEAKRELRKELIKSRREILQLRKERDGDDRKA